MYLQHICNVNERQHTITSYGELLRKKDVMFPYVFHFRGYGIVSIKIRPVNVVLTCQTSQHFSLANHSVAVDRTGVSKEIHDVRAASSDWSELAHLVH